MKSENNKKRISEILISFVANLSNSPVSIGEMRDRLGSKAFSSLILIFTLPNLIPLPIPGISTILGMPLIILSYQMMSGYDTPWFPKWLERRKISSIKIKKAINFIIPHISNIEKILKPRFTIIMDPPMERFLALICLIMSIIMALPIPFANWLPALSIFLISLSRLERDGILTILGLASFTSSITLTYTIIFTLLKGSFYFIQKLF